MLILPRRTPLARPAQFTPALSGMQAQRLVLWLPLGVGASPWRAIGPTFLDIAQTGAPPIVADAVFGRVPSFNGTSQAASVALDLSGFSKIALSFWMKRTFASDDQFAAEFTANWNSNAGSFSIQPNESGTGQFLFGFTMGDSTNYWADSFTRPSTGDWHHYLLVMDRATPVNLAYVDGVAQTLTTFAHNTVSGNFANSTLYLESRGAASLWGSGNLADVRIYGAPIGDGQALAKALYSPETRWALYGAPREIALGLAAAPAVPLFTRPQLGRQPLRTGRGGLLFLHQPFVTDGATVAGNVYSCDAADSAAATDAADDLVVLPAAAADSAAATDSATQLAVLPAAAADSVAATDNATQLAVLPAAGADSVAATDSATQLAVLPAAAADSAAATDSATAQPAFTAAGADSAAATDAATATLTIPGAAADSVAATDAATDLAVLPANAADSVAATDAATQLAVLPASAADSAAATDSATAAAVFAADAADAVAAGDSATAIAILVAAAIDAAAAGDSASQLAVLAIQAADSVAATDAASGSIAGTAVLSDQHHVWLELLARAHGLIDPLAVSPVARSDGTLVQTVNQVAGTVTVTTTAAPSGTPGTSALTAQEAIWLEQLIRLYGGIDPLAVTAAGRSDGTLSQTFTVAGATTTISTP